MGIYVRQGVRKLESDSTMMVGHMLIAFTVIGVIGFIVFMIMF